MTDLSTILPHFTPSNPRLHSIFEARGLTVSDLLILDALDISRRCSGNGGVQNTTLPAPALLEIKRFVNDLVAALHDDIDTATAAELKAKEAFITTGDDHIDGMLNGGIPAGALTEFVGESGAGKTQFLLTLTLTVQLPVDSGGLARGAVYISTESPLSTPRLVQLADAINARYSPNPPVTTDRVLSISCGDLEAQDHILRYQLPVVVERHHIGLVVIDSIAANFRAEFDRSPSTGDHHPTPKRLKTLGESGRPAQMARRGGELVDVAHGLRELARKHNLAVVVANQVSDRFSPLMGDDDEQDDLALDYQSRWFTGWGGESGGVGGGKAKVPALGLVWANLLAGRVVVRKADEAIAAKRKIGVVFANWAPPRVGENEIEFEIWEGGIRAISPGAVTADVQEEGTGQQGLSIYG